MPGQQPYQGIVPLDGDDMATVIENYMLRSEQLDTKLWLAADDNVSRGLLLQKLPRPRRRRPGVAQADRGRRPGRPGTAP
jgi:molecular chaperone Hsp33